MKRRACILFALLMSAVFAVGTLAFLTRSTQAEGPICGGPVFTTAEGQGTGCSCDEARNDLSQRLLFQVVCATGVCNETLIITTDCFSDPGCSCRKHIRGKLQYQCVQQFEE